MALTSFLPSVLSSDANINRNSEVFATLYQKLHEYYKETLKPSSVYRFKEKLDSNKIFCFDSSTITLFTDIFKGAGRNSLTGRKKGGIKVHTKMPLTGFVPDLVNLSQASCPDKIFLPMPRASSSNAKGIPLGRSPFPCQGHPFGEGILQRSPWDLRGGQRSPWDLWEGILWIGQLKVEKGGIYIFDKGYVNYQVWKKWTDQGYFMSPGSMKMPVIPPSAAQVKCYSDSLITSVNIPMRTSSAISESCSKVGWRPDWSCLKIM